MPPGGVGGGVGVGGSEALDLLLAGVGAEEVALDDEGAALLHLLVGGADAGRGLARRGVVSAVHQPETASWSLSRTEEISRPTVGKVHSATKKSSARWASSRPTLIRGRPAGGAPARATSTVGGDGGHQRVPSSALARRMFQTMIGSTASMMMTAMVEPRP